MSGWVIASLAGGLFAAVIVALLVVVSRAVMRTARNASELMVALEDVQARTKVLADLDAQAARTARVTEEATSALQEFRLEQLPGEGDVATADDNGRTA